MTDRTIHPVKSCRESQRATLEAAPDEETRLMLAFSFRTGNAAYRYYQSQEAEPTKDDFADWLAGLPDSIRQFHTVKGFEKSKRVLGLRRHAAERSDLGLEAYMKESVSPEDYAEWRRLSN